MASGNQVKSRRALAVSDEEADSIDDPFFKNNINNPSLVKTSTTAMGSATGGDNNHNTTTSIKKQQQTPSDLLTPGEFLARLNISEPSPTAGMIAQSNYWSPKSTTAHNDKLAAATAAAAAAATSTTTTGDIRKSSGSPPFGARSSKLGNSRFVANENIKQKTARAIDRKIADDQQSAALEASRALASIQSSAPSATEPLKTRQQTMFKYQSQILDSALFPKGGLDHHGVGNSGLGGTHRKMQRADDDELIDEDEDEEEEEEEEEDEEEVESSEISASDEDGSWISWFCSLRGNEFFCEVDEDYIQDDFNLTGLNSLVPYYDYALDMVLDVEMPMEDQLTEEQQEIVESAAEMLYGLIHARYIVTNRGMHAMYEKYRSAHFGRCPHVFCQGQPVLPVGLSDLPRNYTVNVFCPRCHGLFFPKSTRQANVDGAYFGTSFPHLYLMTHPDMIPPKPAQNYVPRVFGFKVHQSSLYYRNHDEAQVAEVRPKRNKSRQSGSSRR